MHLIQTQRTGIEHRPLHRRFQIKGFAQVRHRRRSARQHQRLVLIHLFLENLSGILVFHLQTFHHVIGGIHAHGRVVDHHFKMALLDMVIQGGGHICGPAFRHGLISRVADDERRWRCSGRPLGRYPLGRPVRRLEQAHLPLRHRTPRAGLTVTVPSAHFPKAAFPRNQGLPGIYDLGALIGVQLAAVPEIAVIGVEQLGRGCHQHLVRCLPFGALVRSQQPAQTRTAGINAERVRQVLAPQIFGGHGRRADAGQQHGPQGKNMFGSFHLCLNYLFTDRLAGKRRCHWQG